MLTAVGVDQATAATLSDETGRALEEDGAAFLKYEQTIDGLRVHGAYARAAFDKDGKLQHLIHRLAPIADRNVAKTSITAEEAAATAIARNFGEAAPIPETAATDGAFTEFEEDKYFYQAPTVEKVVVARKDGKLEQGYVVENWRESDNLLYHTVIDADGEIIANELRTQNDQYRVYQVNPNVAGQQVANIPDAGTYYSPYGWLRGSTQGTEYIIGQNVNAYLDRNDNNNPDTWGTFITNRKFLSTTNLSIDPTSGSNPDAAVTNLFYHNNIAHDRLKGHGFTEAWGNFQYENGTAGGQERDHVRAEAQDGASLSPAKLNNANFATPGDGSSPRMQMFLWNSTSPRRDGSLDNDVIYHEYGHGLTWRMVGGMSGSVSGALGEGMSDVIAILFNREDRVGEYSTNDSHGIRSVRYNQHTETLGDFNASRGVHRNGEIYAATIWKLWEIFQREGVSSYTLLDYVVKGLRFTPSNPTYIDMRNGLLSATPSDRDCLVWEAFAAKGMGSGASMTASGSTTESFSQPFTCYFKPKFKISNATANEGSSLVFKVERVGSTSGTNKVRYNTQNGSAKSPGDFGYKSGTLTFSPGQTAKYIYVSTVWDSAYEPNETMSVRLKLPTGGATLQDNTGAGTIKNKLKIYFPVLKGAAPEASE